MSRTTRSPRFLLQRNAQISAQSVNELQDGARLVFNDAFHHDLADRVPHRNRFPIPSFLLQSLSCRCALVSPRISLQFECLKDVLLGGERGHAHK